MDWQPVIAAVAVMLTAMAGVVVAITPVLVARLTGQVAVVKALVDGQGHAMQSKLDAQAVEMAVMRARLAGRRAADSSPPEKGVAP